jgi:hypothetical protein
VVADDNIEPLIETVVEGDALVVRLKRDAGFTTRHAPAVRISARALQAIAIQGSGDLGVDSFKADSLGLDIDGSGDAHFGLVELKELNVSISGSGDVRLAGRADQQSWRVSGSGDVDARWLGGPPGQHQRLGRRGPGRDRAAGRATERLRRPQLCRPAAVASKRQRLGEIRRR